MLIGTFQVVASRNFFLFLKQGFAMLIISYFLSSRSSGLTFKSWESIGDKAVSISSSVKLVIPNFIGEDFLSLVDFKLVGIYKGESCLFLSILNVLGSVAISGCIYKLAGDSMFLVPLL